MSENVTPLRKIFIVTLASYLPAFLLALLSFFLFKFANSPSPENKLEELVKKEVKEQLDKTLKEPIYRTKANQTNQPLTVEQVVEKEVTNQLREKEAIFKADNSVLAKGYIDGQIQQKVQAQAQKAAKNEIDKFQADWKGDLFIPFLYEAALN